MYGHGAGPTTGGAIAGGTLAYTGTGNVLALVIIAVLALSVGGLLTVRARYLASESQLGDGQVAERR